MSEPTLLKSNAIMVGLFSGIGFGILMGIFYGLSTAPFSEGFNRGLPLGAYFGIGMALYYYYRIQTHRGIPEELAKEVVVAHGPANHFKGAGWLYLTQKTITFKSHKMNVQNETLAISLQDVRKYGEHNTMGIIPNGLFVELPSGRTEKFVLSQRGEWIESIYKLIGNGSEVSKITSNAESAKDHVDKIAKLHDLYKSGALTKEEFDAEKAKLFGTAS